jgi:hypothetical protein
MNDVDKDLRDLLEAARGAITVRIDGDDSDRVLARAQTPRRPVADAGSLPTRCSVASRTVSSTRYMARTS